jgi:hypothetical protein
MKRDSARHASPPLAAARAEPIVGKRSSTFRSFLSRGTEHRHASGCGERGAALRSPSAALGSPTALKPRRATWPEGTPSQLGGRTGGRGRNHTTRKRQSRSPLITKAHWSLARANVAGPQRYVHNRAWSPNDVLTTPALSPKEIRDERRTRDDFPPQGINGAGRATASAAAPEATLRPAHAGLGRLRSGCR